MCTPVHVHDCTHMRDKIVHTHLLQVPQVEALLDRHGDEPPVMRYIVRCFRYIHTHTCKCACTIHHPMTMHSTCAAINDHVHALPSQLQNPVPLLSPSPPTTLHAHNHHSPPPHPCNHHSPPPHPSNRACASRDLGYHSVAWRVVNSAAFGLPNRRKRVFVVASMHGVSMPCHRCPLPCMG
jgi:hypothetical protein